MTGRIHSFESLGTVDGPGVRSVIFMQGCPLRCICCHNPDTWDFSGGAVIDSEILVQKVLRFRSYFGEKGGVTVSGGEPLFQAEFVTELFRMFKEKGIHTALDTSGCVFNEQVGKLLDYTDLVLLDRKYQNEDDYFKYTGAHLCDNDKFLAELSARNIPTWLRTVIIPNKNDDENSVSALNETAKKYPCVKRVELLPFRNICVGKYKALGIDFPLADTDPPTAEKMEKLNLLISDEYKNGQ